MDTTFSPAMQVKQYVAIVKNPSTGTRFMVFETGDPKFYLFSQLFPKTDISTGLQFPVLKVDLEPDVKRALAHGWGNG